MRAGPGRVGFLLRVTVVSVSPANQKVISPCFIPPKKSQTKESESKKKPKLSCSLKAVGDSSEKMVGAASKVNFGGAETHRQVS